MKRYLVILLFLNAIFLGCTQTVPEKIHGVSFVASPDTLKQGNITPLQSVHANFTAIMPFGFIRSLDHPEIIHDTERQWFGETSKGARQYIQLLHTNGFKVMMKPQIWIWRGEFTGDLKMNSEAEWKALEISYRNFILTYANLAEEQKVAVFCIGTELEEFVMARPQFWNQLIKEIRAIFKGKLTYAANWDEYKRVTFWEELDFIGVDAYFPISDSLTPSIEEAKVGWKPWKEELKMVSSNFNKPILFTEYGYRSMDYAGKEPWDSNHLLPSINLQAQSNLLAGLYQEIWKEPWFAGGFLWKWFIAYERAGGNTDNQFTPQNKPAEQIIKQAYELNQ